MEKRMGKRKSNNIEMIPPDAFRVKCRHGHDTTRVGTIRIKDSDGHTKNEFLYYCAKCNQEYISSFAFKDGAIFKIKSGKRIINTYTRKENHNLKVNQPVKKYKLILYNNVLSYWCTQNQVIPVQVITETKELARQCMKCGAENRPLLIGRKGKKIIMGKKCSVCGQNYANLDTYFIMKKRLIVENREVLESYIEKYIKKETEQKRIQKIQQNQKNILKDQQYEDQLLKRLAVSEKTNELQKPKQRKNKKRPASTAINPLIQYLSCDIKNIASGKQERIIIANMCYSVNSSQNTKVAIAGSILGDLCLTAVANDRKLFSYNGSVYQILKYVRYDDKFVSQYEEKDSHTVYSTSKKHELENSEINYHNGPEKIVYVYFCLTNSCIKKDHPIETVTMQVKDSITSTMLKVNVYHCTECDRYFINHEMLAGFIRRNQHPAFYYCVVRDSSLALSPMSELMMYGYNVREGELTDRDRQKILSFLIDSKLMAKHDIIRDLQFKVDYNGQKASNTNAKAKWESDIRFVSQYGTSGQRMINGKLVRDKSPQ